MSREMMFYECEKCKNLFGVILNGGPVPQCCGQPMRELIAGSVDASREKHVPVVSRENGKLIVSVGSAEHPMLAEHFIQWIAVAGEKYTQRVSLSPQDRPYAEFTDVPDAVVYAYCNLHGLWRI